MNQITLLLNQALFNKNLSYQILFMYVLFVLLTINKH
jgi:hypothetical protein